MTYVIFDNETDSLYKKPGQITHARYDSMTGCKTAATRLNKKVGKTQYLWYSSADYQCYRAMNPVKMVERVNLMSGKKYMEAEDTPLCCSPASETYWSM